MESRSKFTDEQIGNAANNESLDASELPDLQPTRETLVPEWLKIVTNLQPSYSRTDVIVTER